MWAEIASVQARSTHRADHSRIVGAHQPARNHGRHVGNGAAGILAHALDGIPCPTDGCTIPLSLRGKRRCWRGRSGRRRGRVAAGRNLVHQCITALAFLIHRGATLVQEQARLVALRRLAGVEPARNRRVGRILDLVQSFHTHGVNLLGRHLVFAVAQRHRDGFAKFTERLGANFPGGVGRHDVAAGRNLGFNVVRRAGAWAAHHAAVGVTGRLVNLLAAVAQRVGRILQRATGELWRSRRRGCCCGLGLLLRLVFGNARGALGVEAQRTLDATDHPAVGVIVGAAGALGFEASHGFPFESHARFLEPATKASNPKPVGVSRSAGWFQSSRRARSSHSPMRGSYANKLSQSVMSRSLP